MFDRFKKAFAKPAPATPARSNPASLFAEVPVAELAATPGLVFSTDPSGGAVALEGRVQGKPWRLERGAPSRDYIRGEELRARAKLGLHEDVSVLVMNRPLKDLLERRAYQTYTDDLQTSLGNNLPQEVRWLAMFEEFGWSDLPAPFLDRYSVHAERRESAQGWVAPQLAQVLLEWPEPAPPADVPFMLLLLQGKAYLRMQYTPAGLQTLQHAALVFTRACEAALAAPALR